MGLLDALTGGLSYAGDIEAKFGGRAIRGVLGGKPREALSVLPFSDSLGITDPTQQVHGSDLASKWGVARDDDAFAKGAIGMGIDAATDPLSYLGGAGLAAHVGGAAKGTSELAEAASGASQFSNLRSLRQPFGMVKHLGGPGQRVIGGVADDADIINSGRAVARQVPQARGVAIAPWADLEEHGILGGTGYSRARSPQVDRHEIFHGMVNQAVQDGGESALGPIGSLAAKAFRMGGAQGGGDLNFATGVGTTLSELGAHTVQDRGTAGALKGFGYFAGSPEAHRNYHDVISAHSPLAAMAYHAAPGAVIGGAAGGTSGAVEGGRENGLEGALAGGLGGAALGAMLGGGASTMALSPLGLNKEGVLAGKAMGESANLAVPHNPIDVAKRAAMQSPEAASAAPRRYSLDPAKSQFYKDWRTARYGDRMRHPGEAHDPSLIDSILGKGKINPHFNDAPMEWGYGESPREIVDAAHSKAASIMSDGSREGIRAARRFIGAPPVEDTKDGLEAARSFESQVESGLRGLNSYTRPDRTFQEINQAVRGGKAIDQIPEASNLMNLMDLSRTPEDMRLYRGITDPSHIEKLLGGSLRDQGMVGKTFVDPGFMSATRDLPVAQVFARSPGKLTPEYGATHNPGAVLDFGIVPAGRKATIGDPSLNEVLFPPGQHVSIDDVSQYPTVKASLIEKLRGNANPYLRHAPEGIPPELANAADAMGPQYPGGLQKLKEIADRSNGSGHIIRKIMEDTPDLAERLAGEIPPGSRVLSKGAEGITFRGPNNEVIRVGYNSALADHAAGFSTEGRSLRPVMPEMLQTYRTTQIGPHSVEHMPFVEPVLNAERDRIASLADKADIPFAERYGHYDTVDEANVAANQIAHGMHDQLHDAGHDPWDVHSHNVGMTNEGRPIIYDGGAVAPDQVPLKIRQTYDMPNQELQQRLLAMGGPEAVRRSLSKGLADGTAGQGSMTVDPSHVQAYVEAKAKIEAAMADLTARSQSGRQAAVRGKLPVGPRGGDRMSFDQAWRPSSNSDSSLNAALAELGMSPVGGAR